MGAMFLEALIAWAFSRYESRVAAEIGSPSLRADGEHWHTHLLVGRGDYPGAGRFLGGLAVGPGGCGGDRRVHPLLGLADFAGKHPLATRLEEQLKQAIPLEEDRKVSHHFGEAPLFALLDVQAESRQLLRWKEWANPFRGMEHGKGIRVAEFLVASDVDVVVLQEDLHGKGPEYVLSDAGSDMIRTEQEDWAALLEELKILVGDGEKPLLAPEVGEKERLLSSAE